MESAQTGEAARTSFTHRMAAHCETGTLGAILNHGGLDLSEAMLLGLGSGIFFAYLESKRLPFPMFVTRTQPGKIREKVAKRLGIKFTTRRFRDPHKARQALDELLERGVPVAVQVDMFYMDYIPAYMRAHFNGHYITVVGRHADGAYAVSDGYYPAMSRVSAASMDRARFARGDLAPRGLLYYPRELPAALPDLRAPLTAAIKEAARNMLKLPVPFLGIKGIRRFAQRLMGWPELCRDLEHLSHEVMTIHIILEERGTGGAGFRYMYATFLQQAARDLDNDRLDELAARLMTIGDRWRDISLLAARIGKRRDLGPDRLGELRDRVLERADEEEAFFKELAQAVK